MGITTDILLQEITIGMAADVGSLARFPKTIGNDSFTREVALTGRDFTAAEALQVGFLSRVIEGSDKKAVLGMCSFLRCSLSGDQPHNSLHLF